MARTISGEAEINSIRLKEQASAPDTPASGYWQLYVKDDGKLYGKDDAGNEVCFSDVFANPMTTAGDIIYGGVDGVATRLAKGDDDEVLTLKSGVPSWEAGGSSSTGIPVDGWVVGDAMTYASADDPTYTATISGDVSDTYAVGMRIKLTQSTGGTKYFIITGVAVSTDTTLTLYGGTDYNLENEAISNPYYSPVKAPLGFPLDPTKWTVQVTDTSQRTQSTPTASTWYNLNSNAITIPIGAWRTSYHVCMQVSDSSSSGWGIFTTLSTANNSESDADFTARLWGSALVGLTGTFYREKFLVLASKTPYYLNMMTTQTDMDAFYQQNAQSKLIIRAVCAYL